MRDTMGQAAAQEHQQWLANQLASNSKQLPGGYTQGNLTMAVMALMNGKEAALAYIDQLKLGKAAKANLLKFLGLSA